MPPKFAMPNPAVQGRALELYPPPSFWSLRLVHWTVSEFSLEKNWELGKICESLLKALDGELLIF